MVVGTQRCWVCTDLKKRGPHTWGGSRRVLRVEQGSRGMGGLFCCLSCPLVTLTTAIFTCVRETLQLLYTCFQHPYCSFMKFCHTKQRLKLSEQTISSAGFAWERRIMHPHGLKSGGWLHLAELDVS